jgi:DNA-binding FadR family transcriptional regulator
MKKSVDFRPLRKNRLYEEVADQIKQAIHDGQLSPGDRLPSERDLGQMFGVGRPTVREALRTLSVMGLVDISRGAKGATVAEANISLYMEGMREQLSWLIRTDRRTMEELWEARKYIELGIAHAVALRAGEKDLKRFEQLVEKMEACGADVEAYFPIGIEFHRQLALASGNAFFFFIWEICQEILQKGYGPILKELFPHGPARLVAANKGLVAAIRSRDPVRIQKAMDEHAASEVLLVVGKKIKPDAGPDPNRPGLLTKGE